MAVDGLRIGRLAGLGGLTVRTLRHYDQIGLVRASERTEASHRCYSETDVRRLYQVVALRSLGVTACADRSHARGRRVHAEGRGHRPAGGGRR